MENYTKYALKTTEELNALLNMDKKESEIIDAEPDDTVRPPSRPSQQMER